MKSHQWVLGLIVAAMLAGAQAQGQVKTAGSLPVTDGPTHKTVGYHGHGYHHGGGTCGTGNCGCGGGTVWGTYCYDGCSYGPGLFPPCPNPCRTTLVGELLCDLKTAVHHTVAAVGHVLCAPCRGCGYGADACCCEAGYVGDAYGVDYSGEYSTLGTYQDVVPSPAEDPFQDDPSPQATSARKAQTRSLLPVPQASRMRSPARYAARRVSHEEPVAKPAAKANGGSAVRQASHYELERATSLRKTNGKPLSKAPVSQDHDSALRFRDSK